MASGGLYREIESLAADSMKVAEIHGRSVVVTPAQPFLPIALLKYEKIILKGQISPVTPLAMLPARARALPPFPHTKKKNPKNYN